MIITNLKLDVEISEQFSNNLKYNLKGRCYENVYRIIECFIDENKMEANLEVAYGYIGTPNKRMFRHCFFVLNRNKIIDPTYPTVENDTEYHIFKLLNIKEYCNLIIEFYKIKEVNEVPTMDMLIPEERDYCDYAIRNGVVIDKDSYLEFLKQYDNYAMVNIFDKELEAWLLYKKDTEGKVLTIKEVELLKDGTELWIEKKIPILVVKQSNILKNVGDGNLVFLISDVGRRFIVKEYLER